MLGDIRRKSKELWKWVKKLRHGETKRPIRDNNSKYHGLLLPRNKPRRREY
jgi:hypothetical protein